MYLACQFSSNCLECPQAILKVSTEEKESHAMLPRFKQYSQIVRGLRIALALLLASIALSSCGGGGGGDSATTAAGTDTGTPFSGQSANYDDAQILLAFITSATMPADGRAVLEFQLTDGDFNAIVDLTAEDLRLTIAKLQFSPIGGLTGNWQSYINTIEQAPNGDPDDGPGTEAKLQATTESGSAGSLSNHRDGTYQYRFAATVIAIPADILAQAETEGLNLSYQGNRTHRIAMQLRNTHDVANPSYDWQPATGAVDYILHYDVVDTGNCNTCHSKLEAHGGSRTETKYCVTCHNPGSSDANSGNSVDFKQMIHKLHRGAELPSVKVGGEYAIWGFRDTKHDFSEVQFTRDIRDCQICHAGTATAKEGQIPTAQGDNWSEYASRAACGSCHDDVDFTQHFGGQTDAENCMSCHAVNGAAGSIASRHIDTEAAAQALFETRILSIANSGPGDRPMVDFEVVNPEANDARYDILSDPEWTAPGAGLTMRMAWSTVDYRNTGNQGNNGNSVSIGSLNDVTANGDGSFHIDAGFAVPDGSASPNISATGSGAIAIEARAMVDGQKVPLTDAVSYFSIDETDGKPMPRRTITANEKCLSCHGSLSLHGGNRTNNVASCVTCHNPGNTDIAQRGSAGTPPTDGKKEQSVDFKVLVHGIHAAAYREQPLQVVGFGGRLHIYDENTIQFPGDTSNCVSCHQGDSYSLPMAASVLATTQDTADVQNPADDKVVTRAASVCSSCHDSATVQVHMESNGADFDTTQAAIDAGDVIEQCEVCHAEGRTYSVSKMHGL